MNLKSSLSLRISEDISQAIGKMCNLERSTSASYLKQFLLRYRYRAFSTQYSIIYIVCHVISPFCRHTPQNRCFRIRGRMRPFLMRDRYGNKKILSRGLPD